MALRETAQQLRRQGQRPVAQYADKTSDQVEQFSGYLHETEVDEMVDQARGFARSGPALYLGSAIAPGFLGARFLKSSSEEAGGNGEPVAVLTPAEDPPTAMGSTPRVERPPVTDRPRGRGGPAGAPPGNLGGFGAG